MEKFHRPVLIAAGVYNILFGCAAVLFPSASFQLLGAEPPLYPSLVQCIGMIVGVYGVGYIIAARNPYRHWPIVLVGMLGKLFGPVGFVYTLITGELPLAFFWVILLNDLIWWLPFGSILYGAWAFHCQSTTRR